MIQGEDQVGPELVIGLVTPIGTNTSALATNLAARLSEFSYKTIPIKLTDLLPRPSIDLTGECEDDRVRRLIAAGDAFCKEHANPADKELANGDPAALARLAIREILRNRVASRTGLDMEAPEKASKPLVRTAYVIHSLKRPAEVRLLREVYGDGFILIGSQATYEQRVKNLLGRPLSVADDVARRAVVDELIGMDADEGDPNGQQVNKAYPQADFFLSDTDTKRVVELLFGCAIAPEVGEYAMYVARASRARSLAASRKVGAAIVKGDAVVATGYNDAPFGQASDVHQGMDASEVLKKRNVEDTLERLRSVGLIDAPKTREAVTDQSSKALAALEGGELLSVIEYQRAVHAEAKAIDDAAVRGVPTEGGKLYVTTYPCHLCFKHALSARLAEVVYIEPYPKSRALQMYPDASSKLVPYSGVSPEMYMKMFDERPAFTASDDGSFPEVDRHGAIPLVGAVGNDAVRVDQERNVVSGLKEIYL